MLSARELILPRETLASALTPTEIHIFNALLSKVKGYEYEQQINSEQRQLDNQSDQVVTAA